MREEDRWREDGGEEEMGWRGSRREGSNEGRKEEGKGRGNEQSE